MKTDVRLKMFIFTMTIFSRSAHHSFVIFYDFMMKQFSSMNETYSIYQLIQFSHSVRLWDCEVSRLSLSSSFSPFFPCPFPFPFPPRSPFSLIYSFLLSIPSHSHYYIYFFSKAQLNWLYADQLHFMCTKYRLNHQNHWWAHTL